MSKVIAWRNPPSHWDDVAEELKANPGRWGVVAEGYGNAKCRPLADRGIKVRSERTSENPRRYTIYARFEESE